MAGEVVSLHYMYFIYMYNVRVDPSWSLHLHVRLAADLNLSNNKLYVQTVPNHRRLLIIDDKSLPHKQRRAFTRLLFFKIKFSSEPPSR